MDNNEKKSSENSVLKEGFIKKGGLGEKPKTARPTPPAAHRPPSKASNEKTD